MLSLPQNNGATNHRLSERLFAIANALPRGGVICDVGSDHGLLPLFLLREDRCERCIVTDLNPLPLKRAEMNLREAGVVHRAKFLLSDGIRDVFQDSPDAIVIAGMGGETIAGILERELARIPTGMQFVLQPMTKEPLLRRFLYVNGFRIQNETVVCENKKSFLILSVSYDSSPAPKEEFIYWIGEHLSPYEDSVKIYFRKLLNSLQVRAVGKESVGTKADEERFLEQKIIDFLEAKYDNQ